MKKILFAVVACLALGFASCGNKTQAPAEVTDSVNVDAANVDEAVSEITAALSEQIEAKDATKLQEVLATVQEKVKEFLTDIVDLYDKDELNDYNREMVADRFIDMMAEAKTASSAGKGGPDA